MMATESEPTVEWAELLSKVAQDRDKVAYAKIFEHFAPRLRSFGLKLLKKEHLATEMVQDTLLNVWLKAHLFDASKGAASTWIYTIARNVRYDMMRKASFQKEENFAEELWPILEDNASEDYQEFTLLENLLLQGELDHFFSAMSDSQRDVIEKVYLQEKSQQEVADEVGVPLGTVKSRIRLGLSKLKQAMEQTA
ncbi:sigma-70 family RNA polymerase sigma factor [Gayadomonas joobiniege]|uniref:sigma-70 family RNA polymerase sigma factor n=1 Tax=Gayadomonas joobiniege TaxID=1234606 RepID=UPI0003810BBD|nr:sigma-70 family RNA polymerase sigma factor [Gayadomonas joobiniege]